MTLNGVMALILCYFTEFGSFQGALPKMVEDVVVNSSLSLSHLLISFLSKTFPTLIQHATECSETLQATNKSRTGDEHCQMT